VTATAADRCCILPPGTIVAASGEDFRAILRRVREVSGLSNGQIAIRSGIHRSQVSSLGSMRPRLPRKREQVAVYLACCRLEPAQATEILLLWDELRGKQA
jgi:hypothetical protein